MPETKGGPWQDPEGPRKFKEAGEEGGAGEEFEEAKGGFHLDFSIF